MKTLEWNIYNYLKEQSLNNQWTSQAQIMTKFSINDRRVRHCINEIRKDEVIQKVIITDFRKGYKLLSDEEQISYLERRKSSILKMLKQYRKDVNRLSKNGQTRLQIDPYEREIYESFLRR